MARRSRKAPTPAYASAIQAVLLNSWPAILAGHLNVYELSYHIEDAVNREPRAMTSRSKPAGEVKGSPTGGQRDSILAARIPLEANHVRRARPGG